jgi:hypothetical protein
LAFLFEPVSCAVDVKNVLASEHEDCFGHILRELVEADCTILSPGVGAQNGFKDSATKGVLGVLARIDVIVRVLLIVI